jgi:uncharacterized UBP type Zn finger protein
MSKVAYGLMSGEFSEPKEGKQLYQNVESAPNLYQDGIRLYDLKLQVAGNNKEFLSSHQQDALEYLGLLFNWIQKGEKQANISSTLSLFEYT